MSVYFKALSEHTTTTYGFLVGDWESRPYTDKLFLIGKHEFSVEPPKHPVHGAIRESLNLRDQSIDAIGKIFNRIIQNYQNCEINGQRYKPTAIYLRLAYGDKIPDEPLLVVSGTKI